MTSLSLAPRPRAPPPEILTLEPAARAVAGSEWPVSNWPGKIVIGAAVFALGVAAGAAVAMWIAPPS